MKQSELLLELTRALAAEIPDFHAVKNAGRGDRATNAFMNELRARVEKRIGKGYDEKQICGDNAFSIDFYFPDERTAVEIALGLRNPQSEFEKDILKTIMAKENGFDIGLLMFISKPGAIAKCQQPGRQAITRWLRRVHDISIEIHEINRD